MGCFQEIMQNMFCNLAIISPSVDLQTYYFPLKLSVAQWVTKRIIKHILNWAGYVIGVVESNRIEDIFASYMYLQKQLFEAYFVCKIHQLSLFNF